MAHSFPTRRSSELKDKIKIIDRGRIVFDKTYIPISESYKIEFQHFLEERSK